MSDLSQEFAEGRKAFQDGLPITANPYDNFSTWGRLWRDGWIDANYEDDFDYYTEDEDD